MSSSLLKSKNYIHEKPIEKQGDVIYMKKASSCYAGKLGQGSKAYFKLLLRTWTVREPLLIECLMKWVDMIDLQGSACYDTIVKGDFQDLYKEHGDSLRVHTPRRIWYMYYSPNKIEESWKLSNFDIPADALVDYFGKNKKYSLEDMCKILSENITGCGIQYGAKNCMRLLHICTDTHLEDSPEHAFYDMSPELKPTFDLLKSNGITDCKKFRDFYGVDWDKGIITYWVCMVLKKLEDELI